MSKHGESQRQPMQAEHARADVTTGPFVTFAYQYRDASNYKSGGLLLLRGVFDSAFEELIRQSCESQTYFVAEQVSIPVLYEALYQFSGGPTDDDHVFHEFQQLRPATDEDVASMTPCGDVAEIAARFRAVEGKWVYSLSPHYF